MAAHELGHCRRYLDGAWMGVPAGFATERTSRSRRIAARSVSGDAGAAREEGYADLSAWPGRGKQHPQLYARLYAWLFADAAGNGSKVASTTRWHGFGWSATRACRSANRSSTRRRCGGRGLVAAGE